MNTRRLATALLCATLAAGPAAAADRIKLATLAPEGSPWHKLLKSMGNDWQRDTGGRVRLVIYPGGVAGDDPDMVRKMRIGQLHAAALTVTGLADIDPAFNVYTIPLFFESFEEYVHVRDRMTPEFRRRLADKGFVLLAWGHGGWLRFFSKEPVRTVEEMKQVKIFTWAGDESMVRTYNANGFRPVALAATDILTGLQTGMIEALPTTPLAALSMQWYRQTPYMLDAPIAPLLGAIVVSERKWNTLSEQDRAAMLASSRAYQSRIDTEIPVKDDEAVGEMVRRGLSVVSRTGEREEVWRDTASAFAREMRTVPADVLEQAKRYREEFRRRASSATPR